MATTEAMLTMLGPNRANLKVVLAGPLVVEPTGVIHVGDVLLADEIRRALGFGDLYDVLVQEGWCNLQLEIELRNVPFDP